MKSVKSNDLTVKVFKLVENFYERAGVTNYYHMRVTSEITDDSAFDFADEAFKALYKDNMMELAVKINKLYAAEERRAKKAANKIDPKIKKLLADIKVDDLPKPPSYEEWLNKKESPVIPLKN